MIEILIYLAVVGIILYFSNKYLGWYDWIRERL
jgi:hypothetical protein